MMKTLFNRTWFAIFAPALVGVACVVFCVHYARDYGAVLFIGLPVLVPFLSAFFHSFQARRSFASCYGFGFLSILTLGVFIILFALDGLICLLMALPLAALLALPGVLLGQLAGQAASGNRSGILPLLMILMFPGLVAFEEHVRPEAPLQSVTTSVRIEATAESIWRTVIAFPKIDEPPTGIFRMGIAYPTEARIEGHGVGAIRHCTFCTGSFVEPITVWDENRKLAFDVISSPPPMHEFSIYKHIDPPHLHGNLRSEKGQFILKDMGDHVILEGTTWYRHEIWPQWYWVPITDHIIHAIHKRVLHHIKRTVESPACN
jgi:hypothetical protein